MEKNEYAHLRDLLSSNFNKGQFNVKINVIDNTAF